MNTTHTFYLSGTHCTACKYLIEETLGAQTGVANAVVSLGDQTLTVTTTSPEDSSVLRERYSKLLAEHGYGVHRERPVSVDTSREWLYALPVVLVVVALLVILTKLGFTSHVAVGEATLSTAFLVGLVASVSTCLAVVGGLALSVSAGYARAGNGWRPQALFHAGRLGGFFVLGGLLGLVGEVVQISLYGSVMMGLVASFVMLLLGIHLLDIMPRVRTLTFGATLSHTLSRVARRTGVYAPILLGAVTFFLPCGFTQSMQVVALASGSVVTGALTMLVFALGTLPVLVLVSFGSLDLAKGRYRGVFFKSAGVLIILFALFNIRGAYLVLWG